MHKDQPDGSNRVPDRAPVYHPGSPLILTGGGCRHQMPIRDHTPQLAGVGKALVTVFNLSSLIVRERSSPTKA